MYNEVISYLMEHAAKENSYLIVATHNEKGVQHAVDKLNSLENFNNSDERIVFAQIYGMGEQISMPLGALKYRENTLVLPS